MLKKIGGKEKIIGKGKKGDLGKIKKIGSAVLCPKCKGIVIDGKCSRCK
jgi:hypothetical protein